MISLSRILFASVCLLLTSTSLWAEDEPKVAPGLNEETLKGLEWRGIGPALMSGRIADVVIDNHISHEEVKA